MSADAGVHEETTVGQKSEIEENGTINCIVENIFGIKHLIDVDLPDHLPQPLSDSDRNGGAESKLNASGRGSCAQHTVEFDGRRGCAHSALEDGPAAVA